MGDRNGKSKYIFSHIQGYTPWMKKVISTNAFSDSETAKYRLSVITHYQQFGLASTLSAFPVKRSTIFLWQKTLTCSGGKLSSLIPQSSRPHTCRRMNTHPMILAEICRLRRKHYRLGKHKLYPIIRDYCTPLGLTPPKESTIGKIIQRNRLFYSRPTSGIHDPNRKQPQRRKLKSRVKQAPKPTVGGYIELDTIETRLNGLKRYTITAIDVKLKIAYAQTFKSKIAKNALQVLTVFCQTNPTPIHTVQTDNGSEFESVFDQYCTTHNIKHVWTYPNSPKINGVIERFNRSIQEEWLDSYQDEMLELKLINQRTLEYLDFYHHQRIHESLNDQTPASFVGYNINYSKSPIGV